MKPPESFNENQQRAIEKHYPVFPQIKDLKQKDPHMWEVICTQVFGNEAVVTYLEYESHLKLYKNQDDAS